MCPGGAIAHAGSLDLKQRATLSALTRRSMCAIVRQTDWCLRMEANPMSDMWYALTRIIRRLELAMPGRRTGATRHGLSLSLMSALSLFSFGCALVGGSSNGVRQLREHARPLSVMSFNIRYATAADGENRWEKRRHLVVGVIRRHAPDVVGLQEALATQLDELVEVLPEYAIVGVGRDDGKRAGEFAAILYRQDRFSVADSGTFWFSDTPALPGSVGWGNHVTRICTWARFLHDGGGKPFYVFNVHLDHESAPSRLRSAQLLVERVEARRHADPVIVTGDFNCSEGDPPVRLLTSRAEDGSLDFADTFRVRHPNTEVVGTFNGFRGVRDGPKIDYILAPRSARVLEAEIIRNHDAGRYPSDHFPVFARIVFR